MSQRYVVGFDGSAPSEAALEWAIKRAHRMPAPVVLVHVSEGDAGDMGQDFERQAAREAASLVSRRIDALRRAEPTLTVEGLVLVGSVPWELAASVSDEDLLVVGTHKTGFLHGRVLGSRSVQVAAAAPCSVAVIPEVDLRFRSGVVAGIDRFETADAIATIAALEAATRGEVLTLTEAATGTPSMQHPSALSIAVAAARREQPGVTIRSRTSGRPAAEALLDAARDKALLVLGPGSLRADRSPIGTVMHDVLLNVNAPVLIARTSRDASQLTVLPGGSSGRLRRFSDRA